MKAMLNQHRLAGSVDTLDEALRTCAGSFDRQTLGALVGQMMGSVIVADTPQGQDSLPEDGAEVEIRIWIGLSPEDFEKSEAELRNFVTLRNNLVHHFLEEHDLHSLNGCAKARLALVDALERITKASDDLRAWAADLVGVKSRMADLLNTPEVRNVLIEKTG